MKVKRFISAVLATAIAASFSFVAYADGTISSLAELKTAFAGSGTYTVESDISVTNSGITAGVTIDGKGHTLTSTQTDGNSTIYQNENVNSTLKNLTIKGNTKPEVGIWEGAGSMTITDSKIQGYNVSTVRRAAIGVGSSGNGKQGTLTLNNVKFAGNSDFDINISDSATVNINQGTEISKLRLQSNTCKLNIGANWSGSFEITMDSPANVEIGTVGTGADVSGITVGGGYSVKNDSGKLVIENENGAELHFDMEQRALLYKGSTGFLYGEAEPNVPTIDLLQGLQPAIMVQKALGGLQHPTGDATRVRSSVGAAGAKSIQVYFQDIYLEWPYDAPMKNGSIDVDGYTKTCEEILYGMICEKANEGDAGAFLGNDGNYYVLNEPEAAKYSYVLFNEPDQIWYGGNLSGLEAAWKQVYEAVHKIDPNAKCAGPNFANYNKNSYNNFLSYCKTNNCLPELISWHELGDSSMTKFFSNYDEIQSMVDTYYTNGKKPELLVNEYARHRDIATSGGLVKWLAMFEDKDMDGCLAYWGMANSLNEVAADQNSPSSTWWVYHWYAQMTGEQVPLTSPAFANTRFYGLTAYDEDIPMAYVLFGGSEDKHGKETVYLDNMDKTALVNANGVVNVKVYGVGFSGQHGSNYKPEVVFDGAVNVTNNTLKIQTTDTDEMDAYFAVISVAPIPAEVSEMKDVRISTLSYEAEEAKLLGGAKSYTQSGWSTWASSGRSDVGNIKKNGDGVEFTVNVPEDGTYDVALFYSLQSPYVNPKTLEPDAGGQNRGIGQVLPFGMQVDGGKVETIYLDSTISWSYRRHTNVDVELTAGTHTITFTHINGDESNKGNLELSATIDKIDLDKVNADRYNFEIDLTEMKSFKDGDRYEVTAVAPKAGYYKVTGNGDFTLTRQIVDYAPDAKTYSTVSTRDIEVSDRVYLSQGANTIGVTGTATVLNFEFTTVVYVPEEPPVNTIYANGIAIHGTNAYHKDNAYASRKAVIAELGVGQNADEDDRGEDNYIELNVNVMDAGVYNVEIRYANDEPAPVMLKSNGGTYIHPYNIDLVERYAQIKVNDSEPETVYFRHTMSWDTFKTVDVQLELDAGDNTIRIYNDNSYQFSQLVNSTAPEIDSITIAKLSYDGKPVIITSAEDETAIDTSKLDKAIAEANAILNDPETIYSAVTLAALQSAVDGAGNAKTQSEVNEARNKILDAINRLKPDYVNLADYYVTSYASGNLGTPEYSFDGSTSTVWTASRSASPYVAYEVFYAGDGKVFDLTEMNLQGNDSTRVVYLGTNNDNILKDPAAMGSAGTDLALKDANLYVPFANLYDAKILGVAEGADVTTELTGQYRYLIVALAVWSETTVNELGLSAAVIDQPKPVLWYDFEDEATDVSGNGNDGTVYGASIEGSSAIFDGSDDYIDMPDGILKDADSATVAIYLKPQIEKANQFTWCIGNSSTAGYMFLNTYNPNSKLRAAITTGTYTAESELASDSYVSAGEWTSIIAVFDGENSVLYRDGAAVAKANISIKPSDLGATTANYIAKSVYNDPYFKGTVSDFRIYDKALTAEEVAIVSAEQKNSYTKIAPDVTRVSGDGIKSYGVEIDTVNRTIFIPVVPGTDLSKLSPEFECETDAIVTVKSGTYDKKVIIGVADTENASLEAEWTVTAGERGNAVLDGYYADPNIAVFNGKYYIYPTTDGGSGWDAPYFKCFSSDDLVHWTDEGVILDLKDVSWSNGKNGWAPTITEKNGKYYFYYSAAPSNNGAKNLAVAVADSPTGPFVDKGVIAAGGSYSGQMIDPAVFTDDDGKSYIYWGNGSTMHAAKLSDDMLSIDGAVKDYQPGNFREGAFMIKRNGVYYLMWSADDTGSPNYHVRYGTMDSPLGTLTGNTQILHRNNAKSDLIKGTGHHSVINIPGTDDWYICYHRFNTALYGHQETQSSAAGNHREVCIDKLEFDENGSIKAVTPTLEGITEPVYASGDLIEITDMEITDGVLSWTLTAKGDISDVDVYTALYDMDNALVLVKKNEMSGKYEINPQLDYTLKVFTWKKGTMEPVGKAYPQRNIKGETMLPKLSAELAPDAEIRGNQYMPAEYNGVSITWRTDNDAVKPDGTVTRGTSDIKVNITAVYDNGTYTYEKTYHTTVIAAPTGKTENDMGAYLFVHFVGTEGNADCEQIYFSVSKDGQNWTTLNDQKPVLTSAMGDRGVRDPHIIRSPEGDKFFLVATDLSIYNNGGGGYWGTSQTAGSKSIMIWESTDLVHWSKQRMAQVAVSNAGCTWAPESVYDYEKGQYMVFWASKIDSDNYGKQRIYRSYTTDFEHFTEPEIYIESSNHTIDTTFINYNGIYYRFTKDETKSVVTMMQSAALDGPWTDVSTYTLNNMTGYEGPTIYKINGENKWCLLLDYYSKSQGYKPFVTTDITKGTFTPAADFNFDMTYRHGTVIPITPDEYNALIAEYTKAALSGPSRVTTGSTAQYSATILGETVKAEWSVSDTNVAEISATGLLTAKAAGKVTVSAKLTDYGKEVSKQVTVSDEINDIDTGLVMNITFDEANTGTGSFEATEGGTVTEKGTVSYAAGKNGNALNLAWGTGNYLELPDGILSGAEEASVSFWVKQGVYSSKDSWPFMTTPVTSKQTYKSEKYIGVLLDKGQGSMKAERYWSNANERPSQASASGSFGGWTYVTVNFGADSTTIYINGVKANETVSAVDLKNIFTDGAKSWIGHANWDSGEGFVGMIDDFRLYSRTLSEDEIKQLMS